MAADFQLIEKCWFRDTTGRNIHRFTCNVSHLSLSGEPLSEVVNNMNLRLRGRNKRKRVVVAAAVQMMQNIMLVASAVIHATLCISDEEHEAKWGGRAGTAYMVRGEPTWVQDYFNDTPVYNHRPLCRHFEVPLLLFWRIHENLVNIDRNLWEIRTMAGGPKRKDSQVKVLAGQQLLRIEMVYDRLDNGAWTGEETVWGYFRLFTKEVYTIHGQ